VSSEKSQNGVVHLLATLAQSGNAWVQFGTLALIGITGLGNWVATWNSADRNKQEIEINRRVAWEGEQRIKQVVFQQIAEIHDWMKRATDEFHQGNADSAANKKILAEFREELGGFEARQLAALENQNKMMANQTVILQELQKFARERQRQEGH